MDDVAGGGVLVVESDESSGLTVNVPYSVVFPL
jgi:hypothetical protein